MSLQLGLIFKLVRKIWEYIKKIHTEFDMTIFLCQLTIWKKQINLCDRIGIIDGGKIQVIDSA